ncbi:MAG: hypothetical protein ACJ0DI_02415 [bacterium]
MSQQKKPAHTYNRIGIDTGSASGKYEGTSKSDPLSGSLSGAHYIWRTEGGFTYGFAYHQIDVKGSVTANSTETTHLYKQETYSVTFGIEMEGTNLLSILTFNPQNIYSFHGKGSYQYEKKGAENRTSDLIEKGVALSGFELPIYLDFQNFYIGGKYSSFSNSGPKQIIYDSGGPDKIKITNGVTFLIGWNFGEKKRSRRR